MPESLDSELLRAMARSENPHTRAAAAAHPHIRAVDLERLADDPNPLVRAAVASRAALPNALWDKLVRDESPEVRLALASSAAPGDDGLADLVRDASVDVRRTVAQRAHRKAVLALCAKDPDSGVRADVAANPFASDHVRRKLAADTVWMVRYSTVDHADPELREKLAHDEHPVVRARARGIAAEIAAEEAWT